MPQFNPPAQEKPKVNHNYSLREETRDLLKELADTYNTTASGALESLVLTYAPGLIADITNAPPKSTELE